MTERRDSSMLTSLQSLMRLEQERVANDARRAQMLAEAEANARAARAEREETRS